MNPQVLAALGQSIAYDENKGHFGRARAIADQQSKQTAPGAVAFADLAIVRLLQGEPLAALADAQRLRELAGHDANIALLADTIELWAMYERFNTFPEGSGAGGTEISGRWHGVADLSPLDARWQADRAAATDDEVRLHAWWIYGVLCNLKAARNTLDNARYAPSGMPPEQLLQIMGQTPRQLRDNAVNSGLWTVAGLAGTWLADLYRRMGDRQNAAQCLSQARDHYLRANDPAGVANALLAEGDAYCAPFSSPLVWNFALQDSGSQGSNLSVTLEADEFARAHEADLVEAEARYQEAGRLFAEAEAPRGKAHVSLRRGYLSMLSGNAEASLHAIREAHEAFGACGDLRGVQLARTHGTLAAIALGQWTDTPAIARGIGASGAQRGDFSNTLGLGILISRWARHCLIRRGDYERALAGYQSAHALFEALGATANAIQSIVDQGSVYQAVGERANALALYEEALDLHTADVEQRPEMRSPLRSRIMMLTTDVFQLYLQQADSDGMERTATRLEARMGELRPAGNAEDLLAALARSLESIGTSGAQENLLGSDLATTSALYDLARWNVQLSSVLSPLYRARQARAAGEDAAADALLRKAESACAQPGAEALLFLKAAVLAESKRYGEAADAVRAHLAQGGADAGFAGQLTALMEKVGGEHGRREAELQRRRTHEQAFSLFSRVRAYDEAKAHLEALEKLAGPRWWQSERYPWQALSDCGETYEGLNDLERALHYYDAAIVEFETRRNQLGRDELKTALAADKGAQFLYLFAARASLKQGERERAFDYCERSKGRALLDLMAGAAANLAAPRKETGIMRRWRELSAQLQLKRGLAATARSQQQPDTERIAQLTREIVDAESALAATEQKLAESQPDFFRLVSHSAPVLSLRQVAQALPADAVLLEYFFAGDDFLCWSIGHDGLRQAVALPADGRSLTRLIRQYHDACSSRRSTDEIASTLAERFLEPLTESIRTAQRLVIVPYGAAHMLPFHTLPFDSQPLAAKRVISYLPSASTLQFLKLDSAIAMPIRMLAVGNPTGDLQYAACEASYVAGLFDERALLGAAASEPAVRDAIPGKRLLHFATHGMLADEAPLSSYIALAGGERMSLYEFMGLDMDADLVVLSACETARGEATGGDDILGFTRGLLATGARAAVVSLWPVDDLATSVLMGAFYRYVAAGDLPASALASAQRDLRSLDREQAAVELTRMQTAMSQAGDSESALVVGRIRRERFAKPGGIAPAVTRASEHADEFSHPYYWASFLLVG